MDCLIRFSHFHETFRIPEIQSLAGFENIDLEILDYQPNSPFCIVRVPSAEAARSLIRRSILGQSIHELWGTASSGLETDLHASVRERKHKTKWDNYATSSFKFTVDSFQNTGTWKDRIKQFEAFSFLDLQGKVELKEPEETFTIFEEWEARPRLGPDSRPGETGEETRAGNQGGNGDEDSAQTRIDTPSSATTASQQQDVSSAVASPDDEPRKPKRLFLGRLLAHGSRDAAFTYDLKKRRYISTTSMDSLLALVTANMVHAAPGRMIYDPFVGTGSFPIAAAHFGALAFGSDIDGRSIRGEGSVKDSRSKDGANGTRSEKKSKKPQPPRSLKGNFAQYGLQAGVGEFFTADLTHTPLLKRRWLDGIVCDPPYGVREGLRVLGKRDSEKRGNVDLAGERYWWSERYIPPKRPYSFLVMLDDILQFATEMLVDNGRLSFWMPTANDEDQEIGVPTHPGLELVSVSVQPFNKWSRRLITYRRLPDNRVDKQELEAWQKRKQEAGTTANELNPFRDNYFKGFKKDEEEITQTG